MTDFKFKPEDCDVVLPGGGRAMTPERAHCVLEAHLKTLPRVYRYDRYDDQLDATVTEWCDIPPSKDLKSAVELAERIADNNYSEMTDLMPLVAGFNFLHKKCEAQAEKLMEYVNRDLDHCEKIKKQGEMLEDAKKIIRHLTAGHDDRCSNMETCILHDGIDWLSRYEQFISQEKKGDV